ncbi:MAG: hypothetical protein HLUCCO07_16795 [Rhodobacteraceae bacterium HLUCCO07]|nr:MAG: hypothetical protein HLUCCO07_16795 [Rhodobacteraceae bacterium HLUCCO07]
MTDSPDRRLWCAVLGAALHDAARGKDEGWIGSRDFQIVCTFAGLDPEAVAERFDPDRFRRLIRAA